MSEDSSPFSALFETQQRLIDNGQELLEQSLRVPLEMNEALRESLDHQRTIQRETLQVTHETMSQLLETAEPSAGDLEEVQTAIDQGFDTMLESHDRIYEGIDESYADAIVRLESALEDLIDQTESLVELSEELEAQTADAIDGESIISEALNSEFSSLDDDIEGTEDVSGREEVKKQREQIETVRERIESLQDQIKTEVEAAAASESGDN